jgi:hypothetical protein
MQKPLPELSTSSSMSKADFVTSLIFFVLGLYMIVEGLGMPGAGGFIEVGGEPGKVPVLLGVIIALLAIVLLFRAVVEGGHRLTQKTAGDVDEPSGAFRCTITAFGCALYAVGLLGSTIGGWTVMYQEATVLFICLFIVGFEWQSAPELGQKRWSRLLEKRPSVAAWLQSVFGFVTASQAPYLWLIFTALVQALLVAWGVTYLFEQEFYVKLP